MSKSDVFENDLLRLIFNSIPISGIADNPGSPLTHLWVSLHTADVGEGGNQLTSEATYTGYGRVPVVRTSAGWTVSGNSVSPVSNLEFGECTNTPGNPITHAAVGTSQTGTGKVLYKGTLLPSIPIQIGSVPRIKTTSTITED